MRQEIFEITVPGQETGPATMTALIINNISVAPEKKRPVIVVCPGGGYRQCSDRESEPIALKFMAMGYHVCMMHYSVLPNHFPVALLELAEGVALIRTFSDRWSADPDKIIVCGFSAGGHLACSLGTFWNQEKIYSQIHRTAQEIKPNGMILGYPVISSGEFAHKDSFHRLVGQAASQEELDQVSLELCVSADTPQAFIWHTYTDLTVPVENSLLLACALKKCNVSVELHIYPTGSHGLSLADEETGGDEPERIEPSCQSWIQLVKTWLKARY